MRGRWSKTWQGLKACACPSWLSGQRQELRWQSLPAPPTSTADEKPACLRGNNRRLAHLPLSLPSARTAPSLPFIALPRYFLKFILHDWNDEDSTKVPGSAMGSAEPGAPGSRVQEAAGCFNDCRISPCPLPAAAAAADATAAMVAAKPAAYGHESASLQLPQNHHAASATARLQILRTLRQAAPSTARLLLAEAAMPDDKPWEPSKASLDLQARRPETPARLVSRRACSAGILGNGFRCSRRVPGQLCLQPPGGSGHLRRSGRLHCVDAWQSCHASCCCGATPPSCEDSILVP